MSKTEIMSDAFDPNPDALDPNPGALDPNPDALVAKTGALVAETGTVPGESGTSLSASYGDKTRDLIAVIEQFLKEKFLTIEEKINLHALKKLLTLHKRSLTLCSSPEFNEVNVFFSKNEKFTEINNRLFFFIRDALSDFNKHVFDEKYNTTFESRPAIGEVSTTMQEKVWKSWLTIQIRSTISTHSKSALDGIKSIKNLNMEDTDFEKMGSIIKTFRCDNPKNAKNTNLKLLDYGYKHPEVANALYLAQNQHILNILIPAKKYIFQISEMLIHLFQDNDFLKSGINTSGDFTNERFLETLFNSLSNRRRIHQNPNSSIDFQKYVEDVRTRFSNISNFVDYLMYLRQIERSKLFEYLNSVCITGDMKIEGKYFLALPIAIELGLFQAIPLAEILLPFIGAEAEAEAAEEEAAKAAKAAKKKKKTCEYTCEN
jgi:hypothetical protein